MKEIETELYLLLGLNCSSCSEDWYAQDNGWLMKDATENDVENMVKEYLPKLIGIGWCTDSHGNILCPKCNGN